jgi:hypothetical protein
MWNGALLECAKSEQETVPCSCVYNTGRWAIAGEGNRGREGNAAEGIGTPAR